MKKLLFILFLLPVFAVAQWPGASPKYYATISKVEEALTSLSSVADIATFTDTSANTIVVTDTIRGGTFIKYTGANAVDNGVIFQDGNGQKWKRVSDNNYVNLAWFGAKPDGSDCRAYFLTALTSALNNLTNVRIRIPASADNEYYYFSDSVNINNTVFIFGDGPASKVRLAQHKKGFTFLYPGAQYSRMEDITIEAVSSSGSSPATWDSTKHGIVVKAPVYFNNVWVKNFDGCGIYMVNNLLASDPGNSSTSTFDGCHVYTNLLHGFYVQGPDANAMSFRNCDAVSNGGVGFYDKSFLGNNYYDNHSASNGSPEVSYQRGLVKYSGRVYGCIKDTTINQLPTNTTYWQDMGTDFIGYAYVEDYSASKVYWAVSSYILEGSNQYSVFVGNYAELDQAPGFLDGGNVDIRSSVVWRSSAAKLYGNLGRLTSAGFFSGDNGIGSSWLYGGNMESYITPPSLYPNHSGVIVGGYTKGGLIDFRHNNTKVGEISTTTTRLNVTADTTDFIGVLYNNGSAIGGGAAAWGSITGTLSNQTDLNSALAGKQASLGYTPLNPANNLSDLSNAATARTNLGGTAIGKNIFTSSNPSAVTFGRANADNTFDWLNATDFRTAIGAGTGNGTVTSASVVNANGFNGSVATSTSTPAITISTTVTGITKGNGTALSAATANTDYLPGGTTISPSQITSDQDNYNPTGWDDADVVRISGDNGVRAITSFAAPTAATKPQKKTIINTGGFPVYFPAEHPDGTAANRFTGSEDFILHPYKTTDIIYDETSSRWRILGRDVPLPTNTVFFNWSAGSITAGDFGNMTFLAISTGTATATAATTSLPASALLSTVAGAANGYIMYFTKSAVTYSAFGTGHIWHESTVSIATLSDATDTYTAYVQITATPSSTTAVVNNSIGIRYSHGVNSGKWQLYSRDNAGAESTADLGVTVATGTLYKLRIEIDKSRTEARAYINDQFAGRVTGNMPNAVVVGSRNLIIKSLGTGARTLAVHSANAGAIHTY